MSTTVSWAIGFEHNAKVDITSIKSPEVVADIEAFNKAAAELPAIAGKRAKLTPAEDAANKAEAGDPADPTKAMPVMRSEADDSETATEKLNARGQEPGQQDDTDKARQRRRIGGALSAQDLLRREGRL